MLAIIDQVIAPAELVIELEAPVLAYLAGLTSKRSRDVQRQALDKIAGLASAGKIISSMLFPWHLLRFQHTTAIRSKLIELYKPATVNRCLTGLRGVLRAAWRLGYMAAEDLQRAIDIKSVKNSTLLKGRELSPEELSLLIAVCACDPTPAGLRDCAVLSLLYGCGLRRAELAALVLSDYDRVNDRVTIHGKGNKDRYAYPPEGTKQALKAWIDFRGNTPGGLFIRLTPTGRIANYKNLSSQTIYIILSDRAEEAKIENITPHDLRRTFVGNLLDKGIDLSLVSRIVGHANVQTTIRYDRRPELAKRKAIESLNVPYGRG